MIAERRNVNAKVSRTQNRRKKNRFFVYDTVRDYLYMSCDYFHITRQILFSILISTVF